MQEKVKKFKQDMASKKRVNIDWKALSPRTIKQVLVDINQELDQYFDSNVKMYADKEK